MRSISDKQASPHIRYLSSSYGVPRMRPQLGRAIYLRAVLYKATSYNLLACKCGGIHPGLVVSTLPVELNSSRVEASQTRFTTIACGRWRRVAI